MFQDYEKFISKQPILKVLIAWVLGLLISNHCFDIGFRFSLFYCVLLLLILVFIGIIIYIIPIKQYYKLLLLLILTACAGFLKHTISSPSNDPLFFGNHLTNTTFLVAKVESQPIVIGTMQRTKASVLMDNFGNKRNGKLNITFKTKDSIRYGDIVLIQNNSINEIKPPLNPHEFDYKKYAKNQGFYHSAFVEDTSFIVLDNQPNWVYKNAITTSNYCHQVFRKYVQDSVSVALLMGIVLGNDDAIDMEVRDLYSSTGATHILSVSGLHIGLFVVLLNFFLSLFGKSRFAKLFRFIFIACVLSFYAIITGGSPCVLRAVLMALLIIVGRLYFNHVFMLNIIFSSALFLLIFQPGALYDVGFQLSYAAVLGLLFFQPFFQKLVYIPHRFFRLLYETFSVSLSAMLATLPIIIYYFNTVSVLSLLSNFIVVPLSTAVLYAGFFLLAFSKITFLNIALGWLLNMLILIMNYSLEALLLLDFINFTNTTFTLLEVLFCFFFMFSLLLFLFYKNINFLIIGLCSLLIIMVEETVETIHAAQYNKLVVYATSKGTALDLYYQNKLYSFANHISTKEFRNKILPNQKYLKFKEHIQLNNLDSIKSIFLYYKSPFLAFDSHLFSLMCCSELVDYSVVESRYKNNCSNAIIIKGKPKDEIDTRWYCKQKGAFILDFK